MPTDDQHHQPPPLPGPGETGGAPGPDGLGEGGLGEDGLGEDRQGRAEPPAVSLMITRRQKAALRDLGVSDEEIRHMTPSEAHARLGL